MRKVFSVALMASLVCAFGLVQNANAGVTIDVQFRDATVPSGITISPGDAGTGCAFGGYGGGSVATGQCMDVVLRSTFDMIVIATSLTYDSDNGLAVGTLYAWKGPIVAWATSRSGPIPTACATVALSDMTNSIESFGCNVNPPNNPPVVAAGTYRIGTIVWDATGTVAGSETIAAYFRTGEAVGVIINGTPTSLIGSVVMGTHILTIIPEPGTASLLGLGLIGLILAGRRSRA